MDNKSNRSELLEVTEAMRDYIDAIPDDVAAKLPAMPGFDRDWADNVILEEKSKKKATGSAIAPTARALAERSADPSSKTPH